LLPAFPPLSGAVVIPGREVGEQMPQGPSAVVALAELVQAKGVGDAAFLDEAVAVPQPKVEAS